MYPYKKHPLVIRYIALNSNLSKPKEGLSEMRYAVERVRVCAGYGGVTEMLEDAGVHWFSVFGNRSGGINVRNFHKIAKLAESRGVEFRDILPLAAEIVPMQAETSEFARMFIESAKHDGLGVMQNV